MKITKNLKERIIEALLSRFLLVTFTDAAAKEMRNRLAGAFLEEGYDIDPERIPAMTFNAIDMDLIAKFYEELGYSKAPSVIDVNPTAESVKVVPLITGDNLVPGVKYDLPLEFYSGERGGMGALVIALKVFDIIREKDIDPDSDSAYEDLKDELEDCGLYKRMSNDSIKDLLKKYKTYSDILKAEGLITFADQEPLGLKLLDMHPDYLKSLGIEHVVVDEFQDSNDVNMEFVRRLIACMTDNGGTIKSVMVIGDDAQSIYAFRSAVVQNMTAFEEKIGRSVTKLNMTENYRSYSEIVNPANELIKLNVNKVDKPLSAAKGNGGKYVLEAFHSEEKEREWVVNEIVRLINEENVDPKDIAVIQRTKKPLIAMQSALTKVGIQCAMMCPVKMLDDSRIQAAIALCDAYYDPNATRSYKVYLNALCEETEGKSLKECMTTEDYEAAIDNMKQKFMDIENKKPETVLFEFHEMLEAINNGEIYSKWLEMLYDEEKRETETVDKMAVALAFVRDFKRYGTRTEAKMDDRYEGVVLTTAHSSKGLEWKIVFNMISEYDTVQLHKSANQNDREETRRLLFVSMTRAMERLYVTGRYLIASSKDSETENQFLKELFNIEDKTWDTFDEEAATRAEERKKARAEAAKAKRAAFLEAAKAHGDANEHSADEDRPAGQYSTAKQYYGKGWVDRKRAEMERARTKQIPVTQAKPRPVARKSATTGA